MGGGLGNPLLQQYFFSEIRRAIKFYKYHAAKQPTKGKHLLDSPCFKASDISS